MSKTPRPYQVEQYNAVRDAYRRGLKRVVVDAGTGTGKSVLFSLTARDTVAKGGRVLLLVNRDNLCKQAAEHLGSVCGRYPSIEKGLEIASHFEPIVVGSVQSMQGERLKKWNPNWFRLIIVDEVHQAASKTYRAILSQFPDAYWLGVTATVERHDGQGVFFHFQEIVHEFPLIQRSDIVVTTPSQRRKFSRLTDAEKFIDKLPDAEAIRAKVSEEVIPGAIDQGWLVPLKFQQLPVPVTLDEEIANTKGEIDEETQAFALEPYLQKLGIALKENIEQLKTVAFLPDCESSMAFAQILRDCGVKAEHIEGVGNRKVYEKGPDGKCLRDASGNKIVKLTRKFTQADYDGVIERWKSGEIQVVTNASILYIGFDYIYIACVALLRLIKSTPFLKQCIGRGTRPVPHYDGRTVDNCATLEERKELIATGPKPFCKVLDLMLQCDEHNFAKPPDLIADFHDGKKKKEDNVKGQGPVDLELMNETFRKTRVSELEEKLRKVAEKVANQARKKSKATTIYLHDIIRRPVSATDVPATTKQMDFIHSLVKRSGIEFPKDIDTTKLTTRQASRIIGRLLPKKETA